MAAEIERVLERVRRDGPIFTDAFNVILTPPDERKVDGWVAWVRSEADEIIMREFMPVTYAPAPEDDGLILMINPAVRQAGIPAISTVPSSGDKSSILVYRLQQLSISETNNTPLLQLSLQNIIRATTHPAEVTLTVGKFLPVDSLKLILQGLAVSPLVIDRNLYAHIHNPLSAYVKVRNISITSLPWPLAPRSSATTTTTTLNERRFGESGVNLTVV